MAIAPVGTFTRTTFASTQSPTINAPGGGITDGDLIVIMVVTNTTTVFNTTPGNGFTLLTGGSQDGGTDCTLGILWKVASGEGASWTFTTLFNSAEVGSAWVTVWDGAHATTPIVDSEAAKASDTTGTTQSGPSVTTTVANSVVCQVVGTDPPTGAVSMTPDSSPVATELIDDKPDNNAYCFLQYVEQASPGALALDSTISTALNLAVYQFTIRPAAAASSLLWQPATPTVYF